MTTSARRPAAPEDPHPGATTPRLLRISSIRNPYGVREVAALLGVSRDAIETNFRQLEGFRVGRRILIPRRVVDRLVSDQQDGEETPAIERVLALLPLLARDERVRVAHAALAAAQEG
jgi:hypothetical protein